ncbi:MAG: hypothetical protein V4644_02925 [Patescibacteria group bacterium]
MLAERESVDPSAPFVDIGLERFNPDPHVSHELFASIPRGHIERHELATYLKNSLDPDGRFEYAQPEEPGMVKLGKTVRNIRTEDQLVHVGCTFAAELEAHFPKLDALGIDVV